jgi:hypothetical protein
MKSVLQSKWLLETCQGNVLQSVVMHQNFKLLISLHLEKNFVSGFFGNSPKTSSSELKLSP